jgi:hypothetical protein
MSKFKGKKAAELRGIVADLTSQATAKMAELKDDTAADAARAIEKAHDLIVADLDEAKRALVDAEKAEAAPVETRAAPAQIDPAVIAAEVERRMAERRETEKQIRQIGEKLKIKREFVDALIENGISVEQARAAYIDHLATRADNTDGPNGGTQVEVISDEGDTRRRGMVDALVSKFARASGERNVAIPDHARAYGELGLIEIAAECIGYRGSLRTTRQVNDVLDNAFKRSWGAHSASDFPGIMLDAMNKRLLARYEIATPAYRRFAAQYSAADFRAQNVIRAGDFPSLQAVGENGEIKAGTFGESRETFSVTPYGIRLNVSRVMIVNDNLAAIDQVIGSAGVRVADWENAIAFASLLSASGAGPTLLTDSTAVFHTNHGNLAGSGTAITVAAVGAGRAAMAKQTTLDGIKANFQPATLLTGPDKQTEAEQLLTALTPAAQANAVPESLRRLTPVADANIPGNAWYLFADPSVAPTWVYGYLEGYSGPRLSSQDEFGVQGMSVKLEHDFGVSAIDFRGAYRNPGA